MAKVSSITMLYMLELKFVPADYSIMGQNDGISLLAGEAMYTPRRSEFKEQGWQIEAGCSCISWFEARQVRKLCIPDLSDSVAVPVAGFLTMA